MSLDLDRARTGVQFTLHDVLHTVHGTFQLKRGSIQFDPVSGRPSGEIIVDVKSGDVHGVFKIHSVDHELTLHFQVERAGEQYIASTQFVIPCVEWGMKNPSNFLLKVDKTVEMNIQKTLHALP